MAQGKRWIFTWFVESEDAGHSALAELPDMGHGHPAGTYGGAQLEQCPTTGRYHIQGWCGFPINKRLSSLKTVHPTANWQIMRGTIKDNENYCSKSDTSCSDYKTWGEVPANEQGKRNDLDSAIKTLRSTEGNTKDKVRAVAEAHGSAFLKYYKGFQVMAELLDDPEEPEEPLWRPWQSLLKEELACEPDDRHIIWYTDEKGGRGKSKFVNYYTATKHLKATALSGKLQDMRYAYMQTKSRIVFFDVARAEKDYIGHMYAMAEELKNGRFMNTKYESKLICFKPPHVVFFANMPPEAGKWSEDRLIHRQFDDYGNIPMAAAIPGGEPFAAIAQAIGGAGAPIEVEDAQAWSQLSLFTN